MVITNFWKCLQFRAHSASTHHKKKNFGLEATHALGHFFDILLISEALLPQTVRPLPEEVVILRSDVWGGGLVVWDLPFKLF